MSKETEVVSSISAIERTLENLEYRVAEYPFGIHQCIDELLLEGVPPFFIRLVVGLLPCERWPLSAAGRIGVQWYLETWYKQCRLHKTGILSARNIRVPFHTIRKWLGDIKFHRKSADFLKTLKPSLYKKRWVPIQEELNEPDAVRIVEIEAHLIDPPSRGETLEPSIDRMQMIPTPLNSPTPMIRQVTSVELKDKSLEDLYLKTVGTPAKSGVQSRKANIELAEDKVQVFSSKETESRDFTVEAQCQPEPTRNPRNIKEDTTNPRLGSGPDTKDVPRRHVIRSKGPKEGGRLNNYLIKDSKLLSLKFDKHSPVSKVIETGVPLSLHLNSIQRTGEISNKQIDTTEVEEYGTEDEEFDQPDEYIQEPEDANASIQMGTEWDGANDGTSNRNEGRQEQGHNTESFQNEEIVPTEDDVTIEREGNNEGSNNEDESDSSEYSYGEEEEQSEEGESSNPEDREHLWQQVQALIIQEKKYPNPVRDMPKPRKIIPKEEQKTLKKLLT
jgi:hypothetical protein